jgi:hypothetical protein
MRRWWRREREEKAMNKNKKNIGEISTNKQKTKQTPGLQSPSELYRPSDRRLSLKFVPIEGITLSAQQIPTAVNFGFLDRTRYCPSK